MTSSSLSSRTAAERAALAYQADVHPAVRPLLDAIAQLHAYQPRDLADLAQVLKSLGGDGTGSTNAVAEIGDLVKDFSHHSVTAELPGSERVALARNAVEYSEVVLQGDGEDTMNQVLHVLEGNSAPTSGVLGFAARALGGGR
ncbi:MULTISPECIES: hypothetical protein [Streptomyces]|uniref:Uncharacterized protein n=1 Tax=Streptomyces muensis TaxID=1077944 RepID=A0A9X1PS38_STRM4|nr:MULTISPECIES: hypothetical protein [Streptomyces]MCF1592500.1 hypothetical protein [Streptomyces muensis]QKV98305.1 hypothetical protein HUT19_42070 [Streptomyces sp. NA02950]